jgi:hypothetical protein
MTLGRTALPKVLAVLTLIVAAGAGVTQPAHAALNPNAMAPRITRTACPGGIWAIHTTPARGFNPLTATTAELNANNYPTRPATTSSKAYAHWKKFVSTPAALASTCPHIQRTDVRNGNLRPAGQTSTATSDNWAGYMAHGVTYTQAEAAWTVPIASGPAGGNGHNYYSSTWVGVGLGQSSYYELMQAGTASDYTANGTTAYYLWFEVWPAISEDIIDTNVHPLDDVGVHVAYSSTGPQFHIWDTSTGYNTTFAYSGSWGDDGHAEWIYERPTVGGTLPYLANAPATFTSAEALTGSTWQTVATASDVAIAMWNCAGTVRMALPSPISGATFPERFANSGDSGACG